MAKKLIRDYFFQPGPSGAGGITIRGRYAAEEILLVTNVTDNIIIYNFAQPGLGGSCVFSSPGEASLLTFEVNTSSMNTNDELQIFVDEEYPKIDFNDALIDPVNKIRVSQPENLIDTDFEYGLQPSKWETIELVNNIPTFYPAQSSYSLKDIAAVNTLAGSDLVTIFTTFPHGVSVGTPFDIRGLESQTAEGKYLVATVPTDTTFTYRARFGQLLTKDVAGPYTVVVPGEFYTSSNLKYKSDTGLSSDNQSPSKISVNTNYVHGIAPDSSIYLTGTIASRLVELNQNTTSTAPDDRPFIDPQDTILQTVTGNSSLNETKEKTGIYFYKFNASSVNLTTNRILWTNNGLTVGEALLYVPPAGDTEIGGLQRLQIYYVKSVDSTGFTLCETTGGDYTNNPEIDFTSAGTYSYGRAELLLVYEIKRMYRESTSVYTAPPPPPAPVPYCPWPSPWDKYFC